MNSEELEMSLRTEFESHLKNVYAGMRQEFSEFQQQIEAEFEKHKSQFDTAFQEFSARLSTSQELDAGFKESVFEHLRLARDEGARITATAIAQAEEMAKQSEPSSLALVPPSAGLSELRDAINEITAQDSQGTILKSLVQHAAQFTPRGAFFIIKNENFVGWRVFNKEGEANEEAVREILLPVSSDTVLGEAVRSLSAVESSFGTYNRDFEFLSQIGFEQPERMYAIPLVARGRGVAVLYADYGTQGEDVNVEALETLVRVAGLTVEVLASSQAVKPVQEVQAAAVYTAPAHEEVEPEEYETAAEPEQNLQSEMLPEEMTGDESAIAKPAEPLTENALPSEDVKDFDYSTESVEDAQEISVEPAREEVVENYTPETPSENEPQHDLPADFSEATTTDFKFSETLDTLSAPAENGEETVFESKSFEPVETSSAENQPFEAVAAIPAKDNSFNSFEITDHHTATFVPEPAVSEAVSYAPVKSRFSDRNVDLPIEVSEDERRLHNDARRFARLLVSEIKLYNEQKVKEGREAQDLYERLREAIDRSRDMYDKRVQPPVAAKFDYFHYEIVNTLAEGEARKLGGDYPGAVI